MFPLGLSSYLRRYIILMVFLNQFYFTHSIDLTKFTAETKLLRIIQYNNTYFIGSKNCIYYLDNKFNILYKHTIGPVGQADNYVTLMEVHPDPVNPVLFWCGSVNYGLCHVNKITPTFSARDFLDINYVPDVLERAFDSNNVKEKDRKLLQYGVFGNLGSKRNSLAKFVEITGKKNKTEFVLVATSTDDNRYEKEIPTIGFYSLKPNKHGDYFLKPSMMKPPIHSYSWLSKYESIIHTHPMYHRNIFEYKDYIYIVTLQKKDVRISATDSTSFETRISRVKKFDFSFKSYVEVPVNCLDESTNFNAVVDTKLHDIKGRLKDKIGLSSDDIGIFLLQGFSSGISEYTTSSTSAVCVVSLTRLNDHLDTAIRRCSRGRGHLLDWYYGFDKRCQSRLVFYKNSSVTVAEDLLVQGRPFQADLLYTVPYNGTMLHIDSQGDDDTVAIIGTNSSNLIKINLRDGRVNGRYKVTAEGNYHIQPSTATTGDNLIIMANNEIVSFPMRSCEIYDTVERCIDSRDPMKCGWCGGTSCTTKEDCITDSWYTHAPPPELHAVSPINGSVSGGTRLTLTGRYFTKPGVNQISNVAVDINGVCAIVSIQFGRIICVTSPSSEWYGDIVVTRKDMVNGEIITAKGYSSHVKFTFKRPNIGGLLPSYGPVSGGTLLTLTGSNLQLGANTTIKIGANNCHITRIDATAIVCTTPLSNDVKSFPLTLYTDDIIQDQILFTYKPDPTVTQQEKTTLQALISGGTSVCINGNNLDSVYLPIAKFTINGLKEMKESLSEPCQVIQSTRVCCSIPRLRVKTLSNQTKVSANAILLLDRIKVVMPSIIYNSVPVVYESYVQSSTQDVIFIKGEGFEHLNIQNTVVKVGDASCNITTRTQTEISCYVVKHHHDIKGKNLKVFLIYGNLKLDVGHVTLTHQLPKSVSSVKQDGLDSTNIIILSTVLALVVGLLAASCVCVVIWKAKRKPTQYNSHRRDNRNCAVEMTYNSVYAGSNPLSEEAPMMNVPNPLSIRCKLEQNTVVIDRSCLHLDAEVGSGCFGKVFRGTLECEGQDEVSAQTVAVKTLKGCQISPKQVKTFLDEALLMSSFSHDNVLSLIGISFDSQYQPLVVLPYLCRGDLRSYIRDSTNTVNLQDMLRFAVDIGTGMNYLQDVLCVHRDLAARNCMLDDDLRVKVADFGLSRDLYDFSTVYMSNDKAVKLPVKWMAPESIEYRQYSSKSDMWSFGVTLWEIFSKGAFPYPNVDNLDILQYVKNGGRLTKPECCPTLVYEWMLSTWRLNADERPDFGQIVSELQLFTSNLDNQLHTNNKSDNRLQSFDSGNHSDGSSLNTVEEEEYLVPVPSTV